MTLTNSQLAELLYKVGIIEISCIRLFEPELHKRCTLQKATVETKDHMLHNLLIKLYKSDTMPWENLIYNELAAKHGPVPRIYYNIQDPAAGAAILIMEDLASTHIPLSELSNPDLKIIQDELIHRVVSLHTAYWGDPDDYLPLPPHLTSIDSYCRHLEYLERDYSIFKNQQQFLRSPVEYSIYENALQFLRDQSEPHIAKIHSNDHITLIHDDLHPGNLLTPRNAEGSLFIIDFEAARLC